jgi:hypothetical protein
LTAGRVALPLGAPDGFQMAKLRLIDHDPVVATIGSAPRADPRIGREEQRAQKDEMQERFSRQSGQQPTQLPSYQIGEPHARSTIWRFTSFG